MRKIFLLLLLAPLAHSATPREEFEAWRKHEFEEFSTEATSLFSLSDYTELRPGEAAHFSLEKVRKDPKWLKLKPKGASASVYFDGKIIKLEAGGEKLEWEKGRDWKAPNGLVLLSSGVKRGVVWLYLHAPMRNKFSRKLAPWFPFDPQAVVRAKIDRSRKDDKPGVKTTKGDDRAYKVIGVAKFSYRSAEHELQLFETNPEKPLTIFVAFKDATNGKSTYGGGRYIDASLEAADSGEITIDFNRAYNPYCAYSHFYNCPLVTGNKLAVAVEAGAKLPPKRLDGQAH